MAAHISLKAIEVCETHIIHFIFLPSNPTHLLQPLDVAVFASFKSNWRDILLEWKRGPGQNEATLPKDFFPSLLKKMLEKIGLERINQNVRSGFRKCGILPLNPNEVYARLPPSSSNDQSNDAVDNVFINYLSALRAPPITSERGRKKRLSTAPGKSVSVDELSNPLSGPSNSATDTPSITQNATRKRGRPQKSKNLRNDAACPRRKNARRNCRSNSIVESDD